MNATEELRKLLDERGMEHYDGVETTLWLKDGMGYRASADEGLNGFIHLRLWCTTPEQAIAATLGSGTCERTTTRNGKFKTKYGRKVPLCECCGYAIGDDRYNFCPKCGAKIVKAVKR